MALHSLISGLLREASHPFFKESCFRVRAAWVVLGRKNNLAESAALNPTGDLTNAQFPMLNSHPKWMSDCKMFHRCKTRSHCRTN